MSPTRRPWLAFFTALPLTVTAPAELAPGADAPATHRSKRCGQHRGELYRRAPVSVPGQRGHRAAVVRRPWKRAKARGDGAEQRLDIDAHAAKADADPAERAAAR